MSFSEAFAAARHEVGAGGVFEWHGNVYGTYYANEWQGFSDEYQNAFSSYPYNIEHEAAHSEIEYDLEHPLSDYNISVIDEESLLTPEYAEVAVVSAVVEGMNVEFVDIDLDGTYDIAVINATGNHGNQEILVIDDGITIDQIHQIQDSPVFVTDNPAYDSIAYDTSSDHLADFENNADICNFV
jgi:hypothetical protein